MVLCYLQYQKSRFVSPPLQNELHTCRRFRRFSAVIPIPSWTCRCHDLHHKYPPFFWRWRQTGVADIFWTIRLRQSRSAISSRLRNTRKTQAKSNKLFIVRCTSKSLSTEPKDAYICVHAYNNHVPVAAMTTLASAILLATILATVTGFLIITGQEDTA